jgi:hypothetical protein
VWRDFGSDVHSQAHIGKTALLLRDGLEKTWGEFLRQADDGCSRCDELPHVLVVEMLIASCGSAGAG